MKKPDIQFSQQDLKTADGLERVLQQFKRAIPDPVEPFTLPPFDQLARLLAPFMRQELQATGSSPLNLQNLLPLNTSGRPIVDTHANRLTIYPPNNYQVGQLFFESDRTVYYIISMVGGIKAWTYSAGVYYATFANRPTDLSTNDAGFLYEVSDHLHICRWSGSAWVILDNDAGTFIDSAVALGTGYQLCDGTATTYLAISGATLVQTAFTTPDENTAPAGVYHESIAAYTGTINAATAPTLSGSTAAAPTGITVDAHPVVERLDDAGAGIWVFDAEADAAHTVNDPEHSHGVGTLAVSTTGEPRRLGVLRYFRR